MKLSNTMIINETLLPNSKKAFTLAEVLITLSILGVVAALTIPSLVNRQSEMAAIVKMKKAISQYEQVVEVYMAENDAKSFAMACADLKNYFKQVENSGKCVFTTADGVVWSFDTNGNAVAYDSKSPKFGVALWARNGLVNSTSNNALGKTGKPAALVPIASSASTADQPFAVSVPTKGYYSAADMLKVNKGSDVKNNTATSNTLATACPTAS